MSVSRSVQAAQRRRAGPPDPQQSRGPGTSINSAQTFANQSTKTSSRTSANNTMEPSTSDITKLTVAQAITLITLRLGALERNASQINYTLANGMNSENDGDVNSENTTLVDNSVFQTLLSRLDAFEKKSVTVQPSSTSNSEIAGLKSQIDAVKLSIVQNKNVKDLKTQLDGYKSQLDVFKSQLNDFKSQLDGTNTTVSDLQKLMSEIASAQFGDSENVGEEAEDEEEVEFNEEIIETNLKEIIEQELKNNQ